MGHEEELLEDDVHVAGDTVVGQAYKVRPLGLQSGLPDRTVGRAREGRRARQGVVGSGRARHGVGFEKGSKYSMGFWTPGSSATPM